jgi:uncharacterized protein (DUF885 family)
MERNMTAWLLRRFVTVTAILFVSATVPGQQRDVDDFFREFSAEYIRHHPSQATSLRYFTGPEQDQMERQLTPITLQWKRDRIKLARQGLAELHKYDRTQMTDMQRISTDLMAWHLQTIIDEEPYLDFTYPLEQFQGVNNLLVMSLTVAHPLQTERDAENYLAALGQVGIRLREAISDARYIAGKGIVPPRFILLATIEQMKRFIDGLPAQNPFVTVLTQKMAAVKSMDDVKREKLRAEAERTTVNDVYPAWKAGIELLESQLPRSTEDAGLWRLKGGPAAYAYFLRRYTNTNMTPDQIHELGLRQVAAIEKQMDEVLRRIGRTEGTVKARIEKLKADLMYPNPESDESREQIMRDIDTILRDAQKRAAMIFDKRPKASVIAQPYQRFEEANAAARSMPPAPDGSRPGIYLYPRRLDWMTRFGLKSVTYHEAVPGHFFQVGLQVENSNLPKFRQLSPFGGISAYIEGWGLYAERLAAEEGWYEGDPEGLLGQLNYELFRARRLVVDTGIHAKYWTRRQAIDYGIEPSEVERYVVYPGQACSYMIGELKIIELREKAKKALGDKFSLRQFHNVVLDTGIVPLDVLERQIDAYIVRNRE